MATWLTAGGPARSQSRVLRTYAYRGVWSGRASCYRPATLPAYSEMALTINNFDVPQGCGKRAAIRFVPHDATLARGTAGTDSWQWDGLYRHVLSPCFITSASVNRQPS